MLKKLKKHESAWSVTNILIIVIVLSFAISLASYDYREALKFSADDLISQPYRLVTAVLLHISLVHLSMNMYSLFIFGNMLEGLTSRKELMKLFILGAFAGSLSQLGVLALGLDASRTAIGASDAVSAIFGACIFLALNENIKVFFIKMKVRTAFLIFVIYEALDIFGIYSVLPNIAHAAHWGPLIFGYLYAYAFLKEHKIAKPSTVAPRS